MEILIFVGQFVIAAALLSLVVFVFVPLAVYFLARADIYFTTLPEGQIKFIVEGDTLKRILANIPGYYIKGEGMEAEIVKGKGTPNDVGIPGWLSRRLGLDKKRIYFVGIDYPRTRVYSYEFIWEKFIKEKVGYKIVPRDEQVNSLFWKYPYPVEAIDVELKGNFKINITIIVTLQVVFPYKPIFVFKGQWFSPVIAAIQGALVSYCGTVDFETLRSQDKEGNDADLVKKVTSINNSLRENYGVEISQVNFVELEPSASQADVTKALQAIEIARLNKEAKIKDAEGDQQAALLRRTGEAEGLKKLLEVADKYEGGVDLLKTDLATRNLGQESEISTLVINSGGQTGVTTLLPISTEPKKKKKGTEKEKEKKKDDVST
ncbi:MAG: hypothetical protein U1D31_01265 [Patescibacteria group bacterium]|nr:hypothetical protein [bacterium]MDZ4240745.1 hypothetical protein [Patescibacteria group bacterium]